MSGHTTLTHSTTVALEEEERNIATIVIARVEAATDVVLLTLAAPDGSELPGWQPGAHIDVLLDNGITRQYSLCGDPEDRHSYTIGVLNAPGSRGGSSFVHESLHVGSRLTIQGPRNHFQLVDASRYIFIAGGIGITPIAAMVREVEKRGKPWTLYYGGRAKSSMALRDELADLGDRVTIWPEETSGFLDLEAILGSPAAGTAVYTCGPEPLLAAIEKICDASWPQGTLHYERFAPKEIESSRDTAFEIELAKSGRRLAVPAEKTVLAILEEEGIHILSSCGEGTCGTCETPVLEGEVDHRDSILTKAEQANNDCMFVCVSRSKCPVLVLNI